MVIVQANPGRAVPISSPGKRRSFPDIRFDILGALNGGRSTVNDLSRRTGINWKTVDNHLIYLCGRGWAEKVFDSSFVKIFEITPDGEAVLSKAKKSQGDGKESMQRPRKTSLRQHLQKTSAGKSAGMGVPS